MLSDGFPLVSAANNSSFIIKQKIEKLKKPSLSAKLIDEKVNFFESQISIQ